MDYKNAIGIDSNNMPEVMMPSKEYLDSLDTDLKFWVHNIDPIKEKIVGKVYYAIYKGVIFVVYPEGYPVDESILDERNAESPEEYFKRRGIEFKQIEEIAKRIHEIPEWKKCTNKDQRELFIDKYLVEIKNKDFNFHDIRRIADYIKIFFD